MNLCLKLTHLSLVASVIAGCSGTHGSAQLGNQPPPVGGLDKVNHIIIVMMENHSFDNYFGALAYAPGSPYHASAQAGCAQSDHTCVDGLSCSRDTSGNLACSNSNTEDDGSKVVSFHDPRRCVVPDLIHEWLESHMEANFTAPNSALAGSPNDGFLRVNDAVDQPDNGVENSTDDQTMGFYTEQDLPLYYDLAGKFAISDRYFSSVLGLTSPNREFLMAATSFGHVVGDSGPTGGFKPINGTILDLLDAHQVSWTDYFLDGAQAGVFRPPSGSAMDPHFQPVQVFLAIAAGSSGSGSLPQVSFVDPGFFGPEENDEHPPTDIQRGQAYVSQIVNAVRSGPYWKDSVIFITYDEHGGFFDHVAPPRAPQGGARTPDGIYPGQCADLSNPPVSEQAGGGAGCASSPGEALALCPALGSDPKGPYPESCASFDQLGFRVPFMVISAFAKPHHVSHVVADHTSLLAFIEKRFLSDGMSAGNRPHLTLRDQYAYTLDDLFDFDNAPSLQTAVGRAELPAVDCTGH